MFTTTYDQARLYLAKVLPWPEEGEGNPPYIDICWTFMPKTPRPDGKPVWGGRAVRSIDTAVQSIDFALRSADTRDVYACLSTQRDAKEVVTPKGFKFNVPMRSQQNAVALKSIFLDIDLKGGEHGYDTMPEIVTALGNLIRMTGLPKPSITVATGGGIHVYWTVNKSLPVHEWEPLAFSLAEAAKRSGMKFDAGVTIDAARVLRIPDTFNRKSEVPRPVRILGSTDFDYSVEVIRDRLSPYQIHIPARKLNGNFGAVFENPSLFTPQAPITEPTALGAGIEQAKAPVPALKELAHGCPLVKDAVTNGGKDHQNPLWHLLVLASTFTQEGIRSATIMSRGHPSFTQAETDELYNRKERDRIERGLGWPTCLAFHQNGSKHCGGCPHLAQNKTPFHYSFRKPAPAAPIIPIQQLLPGLHGPISVNDLPPGYVRDQDGIIYIQVQNDDGVAERAAISSFPMVAPRLQKGPPYVLAFYSKVSVGEFSQITIETETAGYPDMIKSLQKQGFMVQDDAIKGIGRFMKSWISQLQTIKEAMVITQPFGWVEKGGGLEGFSYGGNIWTPQGNQQGASAPFAIAAQYTPVGDLQPWKDAAKLITEQGRPALDAVIACSFGAPLAHFTGQSGLMMSMFSQESGIGKTTAMKVGQAVWGSPTKAMNQLSDTQNSVLNKLGLLRSLPLFWDELKTVEDTHRFINLVFQLSSGKEKSRLNQRVEQRETGEWNTILVSASNESLLDFVTEKTKTTTAGIYRVFEYEVEKGAFGQIATSTAAIMISRLNNNYGQAGLVYSEFIGKNHPDIYKEVEETLRTIEEETKAAADERFWTALITTMVIGAKYANQLQLTEINEDALKAFMLQVLTKMRSYRRDQPVDFTKHFNITNTLAQFLSDKRARHTLKTNRMHKGRGKPTLGSIIIRNDSSRLEGVHVHIAEDDKICRVSSVALSEWCGKNDIPRSVLTRALERSFHVVKTQGRMGAGTVFAGGVEYIYDIDLAASAELNFVDEA